MGGNIEAGDTVEPRELRSIDGGRVAIPDPERFVHLEFRRFAGCPICNLHLRSIADRHDEIEAAGIREVVFFHSTAEALHAHNPDFPFPVIADPEKKLYKEFGVRSSLRSELDPRAWPAIVKGIATKGISLNLKGGAIGLPADFLIAPGGEVIAAKHGQHAYDQWSVDELLAHIPAATT